MKLQDQVALITGGSRGIGRATGLAFAAEGADIAFCHLDDGAKAEETANEIRALGRRALHRSVDVVDIAAAAHSHRKRPTTLGPIDILFNNAGMNIRKSFENYTEADYDRIMDVHMKGMFFMAQAVYPAMAGARARLHHQRCLAAWIEGRGELGAVFGGEGGDHRVHTGAVLGGGAEGDPGERHRTGTDRYRPDRVDERGRPRRVQGGAARGTLRPPGGDRRHGAAAGRAGWRLLCRRLSVAQRRGRHALMADR